MKKPTRIFSTNVIEGSGGTCEVQLFIDGEQVSPDKFAHEANKLYDTLVTITKRLQKVSGGPIDLGNENY